MREDEFKNEFEDEFRAMFAERSEDVRVTTSPYRAVRQRILAARRRRRQRIGGAGAALAVAAVGIGVWGMVSGGPQGAGPVTPGATTSSPGATPAKASGSPLFVYDDGVTELPAGPLRDAAESYLDARYQGDLSGLTAVTTFDKAMQTAAGKATSPNDIGLAAMDPKTGYVKALRGAWDRPVEVDDTIKAVTLAAAFQTGHYTPQTTEPLTTDRHPLYWPANSATPLTYVDDRTHKKYNWPPENNTGRVSGDSEVTLLQAAVDQANAPFAALELAADVTPAKVRDMAVALGMPSDTPDLSGVPALTLGTPMASPLTMTTVYGVFAAGGVRHDPVMVSVVRDGSGTELWKPETAGHRVLSQDTADEITTVLHEVLTKGPTAGDADVRALGARGMAGMPGNSSFNHAAWFDGYSPDLVTAVSLSHVTPDGLLQPLVGGPNGGMVFGGPAAGPIWAAFTKQAVLPSH
ncbi:penicillin-binding transpeptidase domain-containing protein [Catenulispora subtropica]|uniref:Penicillin-binding protein transpeptidase domain-containing protein n=1 Tax=Catenulispora subtropica TaxID=450798 RepID=A0ABN2S718_9ACTN